MTGDKHVEYFLLVIHVIASIALIGLVLLQQGKGAEAGVAFGSGASQTLFGSQGSGNFLTRLTAICATIFFATSLSMAYLAAHRGKDVLAKPATSIEKAEEHKAGDKKKQDETAPLKSKSDVPVTE